MEVRTFGGEVFGIPDYDDFASYGTACTWSPSPRRLMRVTRRTWECSYCGSENGDDTLECPHCGANRGKAVRAVA